MTVSQDCINLIKSFEGLVLHPYHGAADVPGLYTIGYGTIAYPDGRKVQLTDPPITQAQAEEYLKFHVQEKAKAVDTLIRHDINQNQYGALVSFTYNLGEGALTQSTLRKKVNLNPNDTSIRDEFVKWIFSNGQKQPGLLRRRQAEADLYFKS